MALAGGDIAHDPILDVVRQLALARDVDTVIASVRDASRRLTGADGVTFVLKEGSECFYADEDAIAPLWKGRRFPLAACISGWVMLRGEPVVIPDIYADHRIPHEAYRPTFVKSLVMVPVRTPDPVAAIGAYWARPHEATPDQVRTLQTLAQSAALALANAQLYRDLRTALERERDARHELELAVTSRDNFLTMLAHELRQPLAAGMAALSILRAPRGEAPLQRRAVEVLGRQLTSMTGLVDDLLDASRIVRGQVPLARSAVDLRTVVQNAVETISSAIVERDHVLRLVLPAEPCAVEADARRVEQIIVNLLANAAKYTPPGGEIVVSVHQDRRGARVSVRDNGDGIDPSKLETIFQLFTRATAGREVGFGIGLAVARKLAEQHGGTLTACSQGRGAGSEFVLELPVLVAAGRRA